MGTPRDPLEELRDRPRRLLAVFAHPDDESYGCAGVLARCAARDDTAVALLCLTQGEASSVLRRSGLDRAAVAALRRDRMREVGERLGVDAVRVLTLPDGALAREPLAELGATVGAVLDAFRPQVVVGHDPRGVNGHPDHIAAHWAVRRALESRDGIRFAMVAYPPEVADAVKPRLLFATPPSDIDVIVELSAFEIDVKDACLRIHEAIVTLRPDGDSDLPTRPPFERFDLLGESPEMPFRDLFEGLDGPAAHSSDSA